MSLVTLLPPKRDRAEVPDLPLVEDGEVGRARAHLHERDAELLLVLGQHGERARERLEHELAHLVARALDRLAQVHRRRAADRDEVHLRLEPRADHADRDRGCPCPCRPCTPAGSRAAARGPAESPARARPRSRGRRRTCVISSPLTATMPLLVIACTCSPAMPAYTSLDLRARHPLGVLQRLPDRARRLLDVGDDAAAQPGRARLADAEHLDRRVLAAGRRRPRR